MITIVLADVINETFAELSYYSARLYYLFSKMSWFCQMDFTWAMKLWPWASELTCLSRA